MIPELQSRSQKIEAHKDELLAFVESLSEAVRMAKPSPSDWSLQEIVEHLVIYEELVGKWQDEAARSPKNPSLKGRMFVGVLRLLINSPLRTPTLPELEPKGSDNLLALTARWNIARKKSWRDLHR